MKIDPTKLDWFPIDIQRIHQLQWVSCYLDRTNKRIWFLTAGQENVWFTQDELNRAITPIITEEIQNFKNFLVDLRGVLQVLATPDGQIKEPSGLERPHPKTQHIVHAQQSHADKKQEIAGQLLHLSLFTAWVKIGTNAPQNPGKKCLKCGLLNNSGAHFCTHCSTQLPAPNEYIIETLTPGQGIGKTALERRRASIQANNIRDGYLRKREDVEKEIAQRQSGCSSGSAPAQPQQPSPQPQPRHSRQVPVQVNCPKCGFSNQSGSNFCNKCGAKL